MVRKGVGVGVTSSGIQWRSFSTSSWLGRPTTTTKKEKKRKKPKAGVARQPQTRRRKTATRRPGLRSPALHHPLFTPDPTPFPRCASSVCQGSEREREREREREERKRPRCPCPRVGGGRLVHSRHEHDVVFSVQYRLRGVTHRPHSSRTVVHRQSDFPPTTHK